LPIVLLASIPTPTAPPSLAIEAPNPVVNIAGRYGAAYTIAISTPNAPIAPIALGIRVSFIKLRGEKRRMLDGFLRKP
jgi:hypothetical protein